MGRTWPALALALLLGGCVSAPPAPPPTSAGLELTEVPFFPQDDYQCGPAALATVLGWSGAPITPEALVPRVYIPERRGSLQPELIAEARRHGRIAYTLAPGLPALLAELEAGHPVLVLQNLGLSWLPRWHYAVVVGYEPERQALVLRSGEQRRRLTPLQLFDRTWARSGRWAVVTLPPARLPASADPTRLLAAAFALEQAGRPEAAEAAYRAGLLRWPADPDLGLALANQQYARAQPADALATLEAVLGAGGESGALLNNRAVLLLELGRRAEAEESARRAVALGGPGADEFRSTLALIRRADGPGK